MKQVLQRIVEDPSLEARWLNTLSLLEHTGARKICKTVGLDHPPIDILEHFADETRHALSLRRLSLAVSQKTGDQYLCDDEAVSYFQMLDHTVSEWLRAVTERDDPYQNYLFVTNMIERRAMKLYPLYRSITANQVVKDELQKIILEESGHLCRIEKKAGEILKESGIDDFGHFTRIEETFFQVFEDSLKRAVIPAFSKNHPPAL